MRIGLDLDGTIVVYDEIFHRLARERLGLPGSVPARKEAVRDWIRMLPDGEARWVELQGLVYGPLMEQAPAAPGALETLRRCRESGVELTVISHRTTRAVADSSIDLHAAARGWLERHRVDAAVYLETSRTAKLERIRTQQCTLFVDDLPDLLAEPAFPAEVEKWLYTPYGSEAVEDGVWPFADWSEVLRRALDLRGMEQTLGDAPAALVVLRRGTNNLVALARRDRRDVVLKRYFRHPGDPRDRLGTEFGFLSFLWEAGVRNVPEPLARDDKAGVGVFAFVEGMPLEPEEVGLDEGLRLAAFLVRLHALRTRPEAANLREASDAAFSLCDYRARVEARLERLRADAPQLEAYVDDHAAPALAEVAAAVERRAADLGVDIQAEIPPGGRTLSPGDIGLVNALRRPDGSLAFVDFEYAGWDDTAHVLASACLPPGVPLPREHHLPLLRHLLAEVGGGSDLAARVRLVYPLLALKWSLILLNDFAEIGRERRRHAGALGPNAAETRLAASRALLAIARQAAEPESELETLL